VVVVAELLVALHLVMRQVVVEQVLLMLTLEAQMEPQIQAVVVVAVTHIHNLAATAVLGL
jgi:hypothetical protein